MNPTQAQALEALKTAKRTMGTGLPGSIYARAHAQIDEAIAALSSPSSTVMDEKGDPIRALLEWHDTFDPYGADRALKALVERVRAARTAPAPSAAEPVARQLYVACRECIDCNHTGINDDSVTTAACNQCDWRGDSPEEDKCAGCGMNGTMVCACPKCGGVYHLLAEASLAAPPAPQPTEAETMINGLTKEETFATPSVAGLQAEAPVAEPVAPRVDLRKIAEQAGIRMDLWDMGAASLAYSEGCEGVTRGDFERFAAAYGFACWNAALEANPVNAQGMVDRAISSLFSADALSLDQRAQGFFAYKQKRQLDDPENIGFNAWMTACDFCHSHPAPSAAEDAKDAPDALLKGLAKAVEELKEDGFWRSCSGCHELNEGHDTGPRSAALGCALGGGCSECGGLGAVWDTADYAAMAKEKQG